MLSSRHPKQRREIISSSFFAFAGVGKHELFIVQQSAKILLFTQYGKQQQTAGEDSLEFKSQTPSETLDYETDVHFSLKASCHRPAVCQLTKTQSGYCVCIFGSKSFPKLTTAKYDCSLTRHCNLNDFPIWRLCFNPSQRNAIS